MISFSEIETTSKRSARAAGFSWGVSEEVGKCIRLLELFGLPGIKNLNSYFNNKNLDNFENLKFIKKDNKPIKNQFCPINLGVNFLDQIKTVETFNECIFKNIAYPVLFLPFISRASEIIGKRLIFNFDEYKFVLNFNVNISSNLIKDQYPLLAQNTQIKFLDNKNNFSEKEWKNLYKRSEETFVEETDSLKKGAAGAGLTDND